MKFNKNKRLLMSVCVTAASTMLLTGFSGAVSGSEAAVVDTEVAEAIVAAEAENTDCSAETEKNGEENQTSAEMAVTTAENTEGMNTENTNTENMNAEDTTTEETNAKWNASEIVERVHLAAVQDAEEAAKQAKKAYEAKLEAQRKAEEEARRKAEEEAKRIAEEKAAEEAARQEVLAKVYEADKELLAALIFCEAGNQPYEGQVAVGAVVINRVNSSVYPDSISEVIYQSGQFSPAMSGWLDSVRASSGYTDSAMQAAEDALAGCNPVGDCLYFSTGGYGMQIGDHFFH